MDLLDNPLTCDCHLAWLLDYMEIAGAKARCEEPPANENLLLKKLTTDDMTCDVPSDSGNPRISSIGLQLHPIHPQVVFEGDSLRIQCFTKPVSNELLLRWFHNSKPVSHDQASTTSLPAQMRHLVGESGTRSHLSIPVINMDHSGNWTCSALIDTGEVQNVTLVVVVINHATVLCPSTTTNTSRGVYSWGVTLAGSLAEQDCQKTNEEGFGSEPARVQYRSIFCSKDS